MSGRNLIYFVRENGGYFYYAGTLDSGVGGACHHRPRSRWTRIPTAFLFPPRKMRCRTFFFEKDVLPHLYLHFAEDQLDEASVSGIYRCKQR